MKATSLMHEPQRSSVVAIFTLFVLFTLLFVLFLYTFLHEGAHALTGLFFGQTLTEFNVNFFNFGAHVKMFGDLDRSQLIIQSVAGAGVPLLVWFVFLGVVPRNAGFSLEVLKILGSLVVLNTLLAWMVIPIFYFFGSAPSDDVTYFLRYSQMPPLLLTFTALVVYIRGWSLFFSKIDGVRKELLLFHSLDLNMLKTGLRKSVPMMTALLALCLLLTFTLNAAAEKATPAPSEDFVSVAEIDLSTRNYSARELAQFTLKEPANVGVFVIVHDIDTPYFDLSVVGPQGYHSMIMHGEVYSAYQDSGSWKEILPAGDYRVVLTSHQSPGTVSVYLKTP